MGYYLSEDYSSINIPENPVIPAEFGELSSGSNQYQRPHNNKDRNQFGRNKDRTFQESRNYSRGRDTDFKNRSYSRDRNQRYQSKSPFRRYDNTKNTYTTTHTNKSTHAQTKTMK